MKVRLLLDVSDVQRYVIAKYYATADAEQGVSRARATRSQVRRFAQAALRRAVEDRVVELAKRQRTTTERLRQPKGHRDPEILPEARELQRGLPI